MVNDTLIERAVRMAVIAHAGQKRKDGDIPYITHPVMVAMKLLRHGFSDTVIAAGLVHDVLEDTSVTVDELRTELGDEVCAIVEAVSHDNGLSWEEKKMGYVESVRKGPEGAKAVSVADKIHNIESVLLSYEKQGPDVWKNFNRGKEKKMWFEHLVLAMLVESWSHPMIDEYRTLITRMEGIPEV